MNANSLNTTHLKQVQVSSPARLHLGFLDLNGSLGRKFGSFGLAIDSHHTSINIQEAEYFQIDAPGKEIEKKINAVSDLFYQNIGPGVENKNLKITVDDLIPSHAGLGSGTQLNLTVGTALARFHNIDISTQQLAISLGRGQRSGIGIASFDHGGFIVDGGNKPNTNNPPMLLQQPFPKEWRVVLIMDKQHQGVHGQAELTAFKALPQFPREHSEQICHLTLMQLLPSLIEQDINGFGEAVTSIQALIGDHFAPAQGGRYTSKQVETLLRTAQELGFKGIAQSSWGPTGCVFVESEAIASELVTQLKQKIQKTELNQHTLDILVAKTNDTGAIIEKNLI